MKFALSSLAVPLSLAGCCLTVVSGIDTESSSTSGSATTSGSTSTSGSTGASTTSGGSLPCAVPANDPNTTVTTLAGNGTQGFFDGSGGRNGTTEFYFPVGVIVDASGTVYVADGFNYRIRKIDPSGNTTTIAGNGTPGVLDGTGGPNGTAQFSYPFALAIDDVGNVLVAQSEPGASRIRQVDPSGNVTTLPCTGTEGAAFFDLSGIALEPSGKIVVGDEFNHRVCELSPLESLATTLAGGTQGARNGAGTTAEFNYPLGVATDAVGNVYVADSQNNVVRKIDPGGNVTTFAGDGNAGFSDGPSGSAEFNRPWGLVFDPVGNLIVSDAVGNRIRLIDPTGNVTTLAGNGHAGDADGTGGADGTAEFDGPGGVAIDSACNVYVAGNNDNRVRKITFGSSPP